MVIKLHNQKSRTLPLHLTELAGHFWVLVTFLRLVKKKWAFVSTSYLFNPYPFTCNDFLKVFIVLFMVKEFLSDFNLCSCSSVNRHGTNLTATHCVPKSCDTKFLKCHLIQLLPSLPKCRFERITKRTLLTCWPSFDVKGPEHGSSSIEVWPSLSFVPYVIIYRI
jgi:hypothetical protein